MSEGYVGIPFDSLEWEDGRATLGLPEGVQIKILRRYEHEEGRMDFLVKFPPGYREPEHSHDGHGVGLVLEGTQIVGGERFGPGTYTYDVPNELHGPFDYPEGCTLFVVWWGGARHEYEQ